MFNWLRGKRAKKVTGYSPRGESLLRFLGISDDMEATAETAETFSAVHNALTMISQSVAKMPIIIYQRTADGGKERAVGNMYYQLFHSAPNPWMSAFELKEIMILDLLLRGNFYAYNEKIDGRPALRRLHPDYVTPELTGYSIKYTVQLDNGKTLRLTPDEIFHVKGLRSDGIRGISVIEAARAGLTRALQADQYAKEFFENAATPSGVLKVSGNLSDDDYDKVKEQIEERHTDKGKRHKPMLLEGGAEWQQVSISPKDSQFLESRKFEIEEVARWFNIPPHLIKHLEKSTFNNIEQQSLEYNSHTVEPWTRRISEAINLQFFTPLYNQESNFFGEFLYDSLLATDVKTRYEAHNLALAGRWKTGNEIRKIENLNPIEGLDEIANPFMDPKSDPEPENEPEPSTDDDNTDEEESERTRQAFIMLLKEEFERIGRAEIKALESAQKKEDPKGHALKFYQDFDSKSAGWLTPIITAYARAFDVADHIALEALVDISRACKVPRAVFLDKTGSISQLIEQIAAENAEEKANLAEQLLRKGMK